MNDTVSTYFPSTSPVTLNVPLASVIAPFTIFPVADCVTRMFTNCSTSFVCLSNTLPFTVP